MFLVCIAKKHHNHINFIYMNMQLDRNIGLELDLLSCRRHYLHRFDQGDFSRPQFSPLVPNIHVQFFCTVTLFTEPSTCARNQPHVCCIRGSNQGIHSTGRAIPYLQPINKLTSQCEFKTLWTELTTNNTGLSFDMSTGCIDKRKHM